MNRLTYEQEIWKRIRGRLKLHVGRTITIWITVPLIVNGVAYLVFFYQWGIVTANQQLLGFFFGTVCLEILLWLAFIVSWRYYDIPEEIYNEQSRRIEQFWPKSLSLVVRDSSTLDLIDDEGKRIHMAIFDVSNNDPTKKIVELEAEIRTLHQTSLDPETSEAITLPFFANQRTLWTDGNTRSALRPDETLSFYLAYLGTEEPLRLCFGEGRFTSWLFDREAIYQLDLQFIGKLEGETEFRRFHCMQAIYAHPAKNRLVVGHDALRLYHDIPDHLVKVIEVAEEGYWLDYSSPYFRQQELKRKEARDAQSQK